MLADIVIAFCLLYLDNIGAIPSSSIDTKLDIETSLPVFFDLT